MLLTDNLFYNMCQELKSGSRCLSRQIGAVIANKGGIKGVGCNTPPDCLPSCDQLYLEEGHPIQKAYEHYDGAALVGTCPRKVLGYKSGTHLEMCPAVHAERNAILNAGINGRSVNGCILYMDESVPCPHCLIEMIQAGISYIVVSTFKCYDEKSRYIFNKSHMKIRLFNDYVWHDTLPKD